MPSLGEMLQAEREKKGLTLKDVENATNIRALYLEAIEQGNYAVSPGEVFLKGFIRNYANFLGLNGAEFVELYRQSQTPPDPELPAAGSETLKPAAGSSSEAAMKKWLFIAAFIVVVGGGAAWWLMGNSTGEQPPMKLEPPVLPQTQTTPVAPAQPPQAAVPAPPQAETVAPPKPVIKPIVIVATFSTRSWTRVTADGKLIFEGTPQRGETLTWEADKAMELRFGNAAAVALTHNGNFLGVQGGNGQVVVKNFTAR